MTVLSRDEAFLKAAFRSAGIDVQFVDCTPVAIPTVHSIQQAICQRERVSLGEMLSNRRTKKLAFARHVAIWLVRQLTQLSTPAIGRLFGNRDHTTIMHAVSRIDTMMERDPAFHEEMQALRLALTTGKPI